VAGQQARQAMHRIEGALTALVQPIVMRIKREELLFIAFGADPGDSLT